MKRLLLPILVSLLITVSAIDTDDIDDYYTGDYDISCNLYCFNVNILSWFGRDTAPPLDTFTAIRWVAEQGYDSINIPMYYIIGYIDGAMPTEPVEVVTEFVHRVKQTALDLGLKISGTGLRNNFAQADYAAVALDIQRAIFWINMAAEMGAPFIRVFSGPVPTDIDQSGWEEIVLNRIVPALRIVTAHAATKGVKIGLQNHGDMTATADQTIQIMKLVNHPNIGIVDDTGYFRPFRTSNGLNYDWYSDINKCLPDSVDLQVKIKPAGPEQPILMDYDKLFTGVRSSPYRLPINLERVWDKDEPDHPRNLPSPPFHVVEEFYRDVMASLERTKIPPSKRNVTA